MKIRKPAVSGRFYPSGKTELLKLLNDIREKENPGINLSLATKNIIGGIVPHAGYVYSAYHAIHFFEIIKKSKLEYTTIVILNPDHSGFGGEVSLDSNDYWESPLGEVELDKEFMNNMNIPVSETAHISEHSGEVMIPLLQYSLDYDFKIVPVSITRQNYNNSINLANEIYKANKELKRDILILASSDFSHYVSPEYGKEMDDLVIKEILALNTAAVYKTVISNNISVCGYGPIMTLLEYAKLIDPEVEVKILRRGHSGEVMASREVVDYISMLVYKKD